MKVTFNINVFYIQRLIVENEPDSASSQNVGVSQDERVPTEHESIEILMKQ